MMPAIARRAASMFRSILELACLSIVRPMYVTTKAMVMIHVTTEAMVIVGTNPVTTCHRNITTISHHH